MNTEVKERVGSEEATEQKNDVLLEKEEAARAHEVGETISQPTPEAAAKEFSKSSLSLLIRFFNCSLKFDIFFANPKYFRL